MRFYKLYFRNYIFLFIIFIFAVLLISIFPSCTIAAASDKDYGLKDVPIGKSTKEPMSNLIISPVTPKPTKKSLSQSDNRKSIIETKVPKTAPPAKTPKKPKHERTTKTLSPSKTPKVLPTDRDSKTLTQSSTPKPVKKENIYLSDHFLHLTAGEKFSLGISFVSQENAKNKDNNVEINKNIKVEILNLNKSGCSTGTGADNAINNNTNNASITNKIKNNGEVTENEILHLDNNCILADKIGLAVIVFSLKTNPDIKASCTVRITSIDK